MVRKKEEKSERERREREFFCFSQHLFLCVVKSMQGILGGKQFHVIVMNDKVTIKVVL